QRPRVYASSSTLPRRRRNARKGAHRQPPWFTQGGRSVSGCYRGIGAPRARTVARTNRTRLKRIRMLRLPLVLTLCGLATAQQTQQTPPPNPQQEVTLPKISVTTNLVTAPVLVFSREGDFVNGLQPFQFHLFDNQKEQNISVDVSYIPISMVICLQV